MKRRKNRKADPHADLAKWIRTSIGARESRKDLLQHLRNTGDEGPVRSITAGSELTYSGFAVLAHRFMGRVFEFPLTDTQTGLIGLPSNGAALQHDEYDPDPIPPKGPAPIEIGSLELEHADAYEPGQPIRGYCDVRYADGAEPWLQALADFHESQQAMAGTEAGKPPFALVIDAAFEPRSEAEGVIYHRGFCYPPFDQATQRVGAEYVLKFDFTAEGGPAVPSVARPQLVAAFVYFAASGSGPAGHGIEIAPLLNIVPLSNPVGALLTLR